jgi:MoxR-like ATPase
MQLQGVIDSAVEEVGGILLGKEPQIRLALCCLFARGHLLIEDLPGMGKHDSLSCVGRGAGTVLEAGAIHQ